MSGDGLGEIKGNDNVVVNDYLAEYTFEDRWEEVIKMYKDSKEAHTVMVSDSEGTALHVAVELYLYQRVTELVEAIMKHGTEYEALTMKNEHGDTPLHVAASRGFANICKCLIGEDKERIELMNEKNKKGETPLFQAAINWQKQAFAYLSDVSRDQVVLSHLVREIDGDSILHCAIEREYFDLAVIIMHEYDFLSTHINKEGFTPLKVLATRPSAFKSSSNLSWWKLILYHCILVEPLEPKRTMRRHLKKMEKDPSDKMDFPANYTTLCNLVSKSLSFLIGKEASDEKKPDTENPPSNLKSKCTNFRTCQLVITENKLGFLPPNYATSHQFVKSAYVHILGLSGVELKAIKKMKKNHRWSEQLLKALMERPYSAFTGAGGLPETKYSSVDQEMLRQLTQWRQVPPPFYPGELATQESMATDEEDTPGETSKPEPTEEEKKKLLMMTVTDDKDGSAYKIEITKKGTSNENQENKPDPKETPFLVAAKNGIVEMVNEILNQIPSAIHNTNSKNENVLLVAVINRQPLVVETIRMRMRNKKEVWNNLLLVLDDDENTMLHLAAHALGENKPWQIAGSALQMVWDIKWFQYIKGLVPQHFYFRSNKQNKTAGEIFKESHKDLVKDSGDWLKDTSESCSVVAGLIAGVSFAAASSIPGGTNEEGRPTLEGQTAFHVFAISSLIGLCFSVTGLIMFLAILTSRKEAKDFRRDLPLKVLLGLSSLFVSIAAMFVSFCTGHIFLLNNKYRTFLIPIYAATCVPVTFYAIAQFPLYLDLLTGILTKVPKGSDKGDSL
ncbi:hypothetical protein RIF29_17647 [Crotalaria pallida]|uniref:PGG domain-containing protein n=1 Tax=Crotalaria pallida TaxID=3830 RepID=A0AAN9FHI1_CROPI